MTEEIRCKVEYGIATVTLNRPEKRNAITAAMLEGLDATLRELAADIAVRVVVLRGEGKVFCSGADLRELSSRPDVGDVEGWIVGVFQRLEGLRQPTIAMIQGDALAGGCELALHCDLRVASEKARFNIPVARLGFILPFAFGQKLVEIVGPAHARQMLLTGGFVDARRAYEIGMIHQLVPAEQLEAAAYDLAATIADNSPLSVSGLKKMILRAISLRERIDHGDIDEIVKHSQKSADAVEGVTAMLEKRKPRFRGE